MYICIRVACEALSRKSEYLVRSLVLGVELITRIISIPDISAVIHHPSGVQLNIVGIKEGNRGHSCEAHHCCGNNITPDTVLRLRKVQIINGK